MSEIPDIPSDQPRVEIQRARPARPSWVCFYYRAGRERGDWSDVACAWTKLGARWAGKKMIARNAVHTIPGPDESLNDPSEIVW